MSYLILLNWIFLRHCIVYNLSCTPYCSQFVLSLYNTIYKYIQKNWDDMLLEADQVSRARLMATAQKESGAWLNALPVSSLGTLLDSEVFRVAIAIRVGADVCIPHSCPRGGRMDSRGLHGLSCKYSAGRFPRHSAMNDVIKRALQNTSLKRF